MQVRGARPLHAASMIMRACAQTMDGRNTFQQRASLFRMRHLSLPHLQLCSLEIQRGKVFEQIQRQIFYFSPLAIMKNMII